MEALIFVNVVFLTQFVGIFFVIFWNFSHSQVCKLKKIFSEALLVSRNGCSLIKCGDKNFKKQYNYSCMQNFAHFAHNDVFRIFAVFSPKIQQIREIQCLQKLMFLRYYHEFILNLFISQTSHTSYLNFDSNFNSLRSFGFGTKIACYFYGQTT